MNQYTVTPCRTIDFTKNKKQEITEDMLKFLNKECLICKYEYDDNDYVLTLEPCNKCMQGELFELDIDALNELNNRYLESLVSEGK